MLYREIIAVCSEIHTKHINTLCGKNVEIIKSSDRISLGICPYFSIRTKQTLWWQYVSYLWDNLMQSLDFRCVCLSVYVSVRAPSSNSCLLATSSAETKWRYKQKDTGSFHDTGGHRHWEDRLADTFAIFTGVLLSSK